MYLYLFQLYLFIVLVNSNSYIITNNFYPSLVPIVILTYSFIPISLTSISEKYIEIINEKPSFLAGFSLIISSSLLLIAINEIASGAWLSISIIIIAGGLSYTASYSNKQLLLYLSLIIWIFGLGYLIFGLRREETIGIVIFNTRFFAYLISSAILYFTYKNLQKFKPFPFSQFYVQNYYQLTLKWTLKNTKGVERNFLKFYSKFFYYIFIF